MNVAKQIGLLFLFCFTPLLIYGQENLLQRSILLSPKTNTVTGHIENLFDQYHISLAFNSSRVELNKNVTIAEKLPLEQFIQKLFAPNSVKLSAKDNKVIIQIEELSEVSYITIRGIVQDRNSGEILVGASILEKKTYVSTFTNENGFYSLQIPESTNEVEFRYLGYKTATISNIEQRTIDIELDFDNELSQVVISETVSDNFLLGSGGERIDMSINLGLNSFAGENDVIKSAHVNSGVQSGNEGQTGFLVRGGSPDQNLVLFEGIPLYEISHTAGLSSIFIDESIHNVDLIKNGFPARYGGRLSSVLDVKLKDGDRSKYHGSARFSIPSATFHIDGPIVKDKTTFNFSARQSYIDRYLNKIAGDLLNYEIGLKYQDFVAKLSHRFSNTTKLSVSFYTGGDDVSLNRQEIDNLGEDFFASNLDNRIKWGNTVYNINFSHIINDKLILNANIGGVWYRYASRSTYNLESFIAGLNTEEEVDIISYSTIFDKLGNISLDYYIHDSHRLKFGVGMNRHRYTPAVLSNRQRINGDIDSLISQDNVIIADEYSLYVEDIYNPNDHWELYFGGHLSSYDVENIWYTNFQPRTSVVYKPDNLNRFTLSYTKMNQYVHLLVNPSIGIPSNLWVPSTERIKPESAHQISLEYNTKLAKGMVLTCGVYKKWLYNLVDFRSTNIFVDILGGSERPTFLQDPEWRNKVEIGKGSAQGVEIEFRKDYGKLQGWASYAYAKADRQFAAINDGNKFPYKHDRRHDINLGLKYIFSPSWCFSANWVYGTGNTFSLAIEEFSTPLGIKTLVNGGKRNQHRFPPYHALDIQFNYKKNLKYGTFTFNLGLFNAYNRKNVYYIYVYDNPFIGESDVRKTTLFPILPNLSLGYSF